MGSYKIKNQMIKIGEKTSNWYKIESAIIENKANIKMIKSTNDQENSLSKIQLIVVNISEGTT